MRDYPPGIAAKVHYVYELYAQDGTCLYIGCSMQIGMRIQQHLSKPWWPDVTRVQIARHDSFDAGRQAERERIESLKPTHNIEFTDRPYADGWATRRANSARRFARIRSNGDHP